MAASDPAPGPVDHSGLTDDAKCFAFMPLRDQRGNHRDTPGSVKSKSTRFCPSLKELGGQLRRVNRAYYLQSVY